jgi:hypothetical protein
MLLDQLTVENCLKMLDLAYKYNINHLKAKSTDIFVANRTAVLTHAKNWRKTMRHVPPSVVELLSIQPGGGSKL